MTERDPEPWRMAAVVLAEYACGYEHGRSKDDPVYLEVCEHRDTGMLRAHYSSCGDLGHWLAERLGVRESWVNRQSLGHYRVGMNVALLGFGCPASHDAPTGPDWTGPQPGDICEIWNTSTGYDAHVFVALGPGSDLNHLRTANYGAGGMSAASFPGAKISDSAFTHHPDGWYVGTRKLHRIISLADLAQLSKVPPDLTGAKSPGEVIDAVHAAKWTDGP